MLVTIMVDSYIKCIAAAVALYLLWQWWSNRKQSFRDYTDYMVLGGDSTPPVTEMPTPIYNDWNVSGYDSFAQSFSPWDSNDFIMMESTPVPEEVTMQP